MVWNEQKITLDVKVKEDEEPRSRKACLQDLARWCRKMVDKNGGYSLLCLYVLIEGIELWKNEEEEVMQRYGDIMILIE